MSQRPCAHRSHGPRGARRSAGRLSTSALDWFALASECPVHRGPTDSENVADLRDRHVLLLVQAPGSSYLIGRQPGRPTAVPPSSSRGREAGVRAFSDEIPFELGQGGEDMEHEPATGRGGVDRLLQRSEPDTSLPQCLQLVDQMPDRSPEPVEPPHDESVAWSELIEQLGELRPVLERSGHCVDPHPVAAGSVQRVELQRRVLIGRRHPRVPEKLTPDSERSGTRRTSVETARRNRH